MSNLNIVDIIGTRKKYFYIIAFFVEIANTMLFIYQVLGLVIFVAITIMFFIIVAPLIIFNDYKIIKCLRKSVIEKEEIIGKKEDIINEIEVEMENSDLLKRKINNGIMYISNIATVTLNKSQHLYKFRFEKTFKIICDNYEKYYLTQFYVNKLLSQEPEENINYYKIPGNEIKWHDLKVKAKLQYKENDKKKFGDEFADLKILNFGDGSVCIPFQIYYENVHGKLSFNKGTIVKLTYWYEVPVKLWGSYLNRSSSFFEESIVVNLIHSGKLDFFVDSLSTLDGTPSLLSGDEISWDSTEDSGFRTEKICLPLGKFKHYRVRWESKEYFGEDINTDKGADTLNITQY